MAKENTRVLALGLEPRGRTYVVPCKMDKTSARLHRSLIFSHEKGMRGFLFGIRDQCICAACAGLAIAR
jgi:hypothetical protein